MSCSFDEDPFQTAPAFPFETATFLQLCVNAGLRFRTSFSPSGGGDPVGFIGKVCDSHFEHKRANRLKITISGGVACVIHVEAPEMDIVSFLKLKDLAMADSNVRSQLPGPSILKTPTKPSVKQSQSFPVVRSSKRASDLVSISKQEKKPRLTFTSTTSSESSKPRIYGSKVIQQPATTPSSSPFKVSPASNALEACLKTYSRFSYTPVMKGFQNLGNTCYMNALLTSLLSLDSFRASLMSARLFAPSESSAISSLAALSDVLGKASDARSLLELKDLVSDHSKCKCLCL